MQLEDQVVSLELAKKLKELGVKQESYFWWREDNLLVPDLHRNDYHPDFTWYSAFTVAELGEMLPSGAHSGRADSIASDMPSLYFCRLPEPIADKWHQEIATTEADARAKVLIYLIENNLITL